VGISISQSAGGCTAALPAPPFIYIDQGSCKRLGREVGVGHSGWQSGTHGQGRTHLAADWSAEGEDPRPRIADLFDCLTDAKNSLFRKIFPCFVFKISLFISVRKFLHKTRRTLQLFRTKAMLGVPGLHGKNPCTFRLTGKSWRRGPQRKHALRRDKLPGIKPSSLPRRTVDLVFGGRD
jgi:hypothetical protein